MNDAAQVCKQTAHARNVWTYFAFTCMLLMRVHVRIYASFLFILISFSMWSIDGQTKDVSGMKKHQVLMQICRHFEKCQWKLYFEFSVALRGHQQTTVLLTLDWSRAPKKLRRKLKQLLKLLILANCFFYGILHVIFTWQKTVSCLFNGKILSLSCPVAKCLFQLCLVWRHAHVYCICTFKIKSSFLPSGKMSSHWNNEDLLRKEETIH